MMGRGDCSQTLWLRQNVSSCCVQVRVPQPHTSSEYIRPWEYQPQGSQDEDLSCHPVSLGS